MNRKQAIEYVEQCHPLKVSDGVIRALAGLGDEQALMRELDAAAYTQNGETLLRIVREHVCRGLDAPGIFDERDQLREALDISRKYNAELNETIGRIARDRDKLARQNKAEVSRADETLHALAEMRKDRAAANEAARIHALERTRAETQCDELRATADRVTRHRDAIKTQCENAERKLRDTECELNTIREQRNRLDARVRELVKSNEVLCKDFDAMNRERHAAIKELAADRARRQVDHAMRTPIDYTPARDALEECGRLTRARDAIAADLNLKCKLLADERLNHGFTRGERDALADRLGRYRSAVRAAHKLVERERAYDMAFVELAGELDKVGE